MQLCKGLRNGLSTQSRNPVVIIAAILLQISSAFCILDKRRRIEDGTNLTRGFI